MRILLVVDDNREFPRLEADQPLEARPQISHPAKPSLVLGEGIANHERVEADADLRQIDAIVHAHPVNFPGGVVTRQQLARALEVERNAQLSRQHVRRAERQNSQRRLRASDAVRYGRDGAVAARGNNQVNASGESRAHDRSDLIVGGTSRGSRKCRGEKAARECDEPPRPCPRRPPG